METVIASAISVVIGVVGKVIYDLCKRRIDDQPGKDALDRGLKTLDLWTGLKDAGLDSVPDIGELLNGVNRRDERECTGLEKSLFAVSACKAAESVVGYTLLLEVVERAETSGSEENEIESSVPSLRKRVENANAAWKDLRDVAMDVCEEGEKRLVMDYGGLVNLALINELNEGEPRD